MTDLMEIFDTDKGGVRKILRAAGVCNPGVRRGRRARAGCLAARGGVGPRIGCQLQQPAPYLRLLHK